MKRFLVGLLLGLLSVILPGLVLAEGIIDYQKIQESPPVDSRLVEGIQKYPVMVEEQGVGFLEEWGGPNQYKELVRFPVEERVVYAAILDGYTEQGKIETLTGLSLLDVNESLYSLKDEGLVVFELPVKELPEPIDSIKPIEPIVK